jgi:hypothetical protein
MQELHLLLLQPPIKSFILNKSDICLRLAQAKNRYFVYILINENNEITYIGRTSSIYDRLVYHKYRKDFIKMLLFEYEDYKEIYEVETTLIKIYKPIYNIKCVNAA